MARTDKFRKDHTDILTVLRELKGLMNETTLAADGTAARSCVSRLLGMLTLHLAAEDRSLYPELAKSSDPAIVKMARQFSDEMAKTAPAVVGYGKRWPTPTSIKENPKQFIAETADLARALIARIQREDQELYPAADRI